MLPRAFTVRKVTRETIDTYTLELLAQDGQGFNFKPGQFNMLYAFGVGEAPISICGAPASTGVLTHTVRAVGAVTNAICALKPGMTVGVRGPYGTSWPVDLAEGKDVVIVAGGIGLPPLRPAIYHVLANREKYGNVVLLYGARTPADLVYKKELEQWRGRFDFEVDVTVDSAANGWRGHVGVVTRLIPGARFDPHHTIAMVVGPEIMMRFTLMDLQKGGLSPQQIYISMERNMKCGVGLCGHCQMGPTFVCKNGPVYRYDTVSELLGKREI